MKKILFAVALLVGTAHAESRFSKVVDRTLASVVKIEVVGIQNGDIHEWLGTGVIIDSAGHILTCAHVCPTGPGMMYARLYRSSDTVILLTIIRRDPKRDLALLQLVKYSTPTPHVELAAKSPLVGDEVVAVGMPFGLQWSVTAGIISALHRDGLAVNLTQTDTAINPGNSGGPLFDLDSRIVGINESVAVNANGVGFAVPVEEIRTFLAIFRGLEETF